MAEKQKPSDVGLGQGGKLCNMPHRQRIAFIAEGLPVIHTSAQSLLHASRALAQHPREAQVLEGHAEEECAKILILLDIVRCPKRLCASRVGPMMRWFYDHLARLLYVKAQSWKPTSADELQSYLDNERKTHYLEGDYGEIVMPNWELYSRESTLYTDILCDEHGELSWQSPSMLGMWPPFMEPIACRLVSALDALGVFTPRGLELMHKLWNRVEFVGNQDPYVTHDLTRQLLTELDAAGLITERAEDSHVTALWHWQMPMYHMDFSRIPVSSEELARLQERQNPMDW